jgi:transposase
MAGNTSDKTTLKGFLAKIESMYGKARRVWVMDRGIPTEAVLQQMRQEEMAYLVGTPKSALKKLEKELVDKPWEQVHAGMKVRLLQRDGELYVQANSADRQRKENAMRRRKLQKLVQGLNRLKRRKRLSRDQLLRKVAVLKKEAGRVSAFVTVREPLAGEEVNRKTFICTFDRAGWKEAMERDGCYLLRGHVPWADHPRGMDRSAEVLWTWYMQLVQVEESFKTLKSDLSLRPIYHQLECRMEAHILVAFLGYCLTVTLRMKLRRWGSGLTPREVLTELSGIKMLEVQVPTSDGRTLVLPRHTEPEPSHLMILEKLGLSLPPQPPPRIRSSQLAEDAAGRSG